jgi:uncharacterized membrane protein
MEVALPFTPRASNRILNTATFLAGSSLVVAGARRRSLAGAGLAGAGGFLMYRAVATRDSLPAEIKRFMREGIHVQRSVAIQASPQDLYDFWRSFENLPLFMGHLDRVEPRADGTSVWCARGPLGMKFEWHAGITNEQPGSRIEWRSLPNSDVQNSGSVSFRALPHDRGTEVCVSLSYQAPAGKLGAAFATVLGTEPDQVVREDLRRLKQLIEAGEIATTDGQPAGPRSRSFATLKMLLDAQTKGRERRPQLVASRRTA